MAKHNAMDVSMIRRDGLALVMEYDPIAASPLSTFPWGKGGARCGYFKEVYAMFIKISYDDPQKGG